MASSSPDSAPRGGEQAAAATRPLHPRSFKLRFAPVRESGRSYVSLVKPIDLPAPVADKFYARAQLAGAAAASEARAWRRVCDAFECGPRERLRAPLLTSHEYGWRWEAARAGWRLRGDPRVHRPIHESPALRAHLRP